MSTWALAKDCDELMLDVMDRSDRQGLTQTLLVHFECDKEEEADGIEDDPEPGSRELDDIDGGSHEPDHDLFEEAYYN